MIEGHEDDGARGLAVETVNIQELPEGSVVEIHEAEAFPVIKHRAQYAYVCADSQMRILTTTADARVYGADSLAELYVKLTSRGFRPIEPN